MSKAFTLGIIAAMEEEVEYLRSRIKNSKTTNEGTIELYSGEIDGVSIILVRSGIGKVNAAVAATLLIRDFHPSCIINTGSAGGLLEGMQIGDIIISSKVFHHDVDITPLGFKPGEIPGHQVYYESDKHLIDIAKASTNIFSELNSSVEIIGTGDSFIADEGYVEEVKEKFAGVAAIEMEAAAIAQVCHLFQVPFVVIRALSDIAGEKPHKTFNQFLAEAGKNSADMVIEILHEIKNNYTGLQT